MGSEAEETTTRGHHSVIPARVGPAPQPLDAGQLDALRDVPLADISDAVGRLYTCEPRLRPAFPQMPRLIGTAITVKAPPGDNWAVHGALATAGPGHVIVIDWRDHRSSCGAGVSALLPALKRGLAGVVIDGSWRDLAEVADIDFPLICTGTSPFSPPKNELGEINVPVSCGGVVVEPGDLVIGDHEGVVIVPRAYVATVVDAVAVHTRVTSIDTLDADTNQEDVSRIARQYWDQFARTGGQGSPGLQEIPGSTRTEKP